MTVGIKIDLMNRPPVPFDFPHRCFELSYRIQSALEIFTGAEPWGREMNEKSGSLIVSLHKLRNLIREAKELLSTAPGSPYDQVWAKLLGEDHPHWRRDRFAGGIWPSSTWVEATRVPSTSIEEEPIAGLLRDFGGVPKRIEDLGLYMLRIIQAGTGNALPAVLVVQVGR